MPITIKSATVKFRDPSTGDYVGVDAVAETTTSEQQAAIVATGAEVRASIPQDYSTLSSAVTTLQGAVVFATVSETKTYLGIT